MMRVRELTKSLVKDIGLHIVNEPNTLRILEDTSYCPFMAEDCCEGAKDSD